MLLGGCMLQRLRGERQQRLLTYTVHILKRNKTKIIDRYSELVTSVLYRRLRISHIAKLGAGVSATRKWTG